VKASIKVGLAVFAVLILGRALPVAAQDVPKMDVGVYYQGAWSDEKLYRYGFNVDGSVPVTPSLSILAELGWARHSIEEILRSPSTGDPLPSSHANFNYINYGGGVRWMRRSEGFSPFIQVVVGVQRDVFDTGSGPAFGILVDQKFTRNNIQVQPGAGVVIPINETIGTVVGVDYRFVMIDTDGLPAAFRAAQSIGKNYVRYIVGLRVNHR
jgi:hypothetical protein